MVDVVRLLYGDDRPKGLLNERIFHPHFEVLRTMKESPARRHSVTNVYFYISSVGCVLSGVLSLTGLMMASEIWTDKMDSLVVLVVNNKIVQSVERCRTA